MYVASVYVEFVTVGSVVVTSLQII